MIPYKPPYGFREAAHASHLLVSFLKLFESELPSELVLPYNHPPSQWQLFSNCCVQKNFQNKVYNKAEEISIQIIYYRIFDSPLFVRSICAWDWLCMITFWASRGPGWQQNVFEQSQLCVVSGV